MNIREELSALEHKQWAHWTKYMLANLTPENVARWKRQCDTEYSELSETEKNSDREWADRVLGVFDTFTIIDVPTVALIDELSLRKDCEEALQVVRGKL